MSRFVSSGVVPSSGSVKASCSMPPWTFFWLLSMWKPKTSAAGRRPERAKARAMGAACTWSTAGART